MWRPITLGSRSAALHVDDGSVRDTGDRAGITASDAEGVDVEALQAHLDVPVLDRREHLLRHGDVLLHDEVRAVGVLADDPLLSSCFVSMPSETPWPPKSEGGLSTSFSRLSATNEQVERPVPVAHRAGPQDARPRDRGPDDVRLVALDEVREAQVLEQREQLLVGHPRAERVDEADAPVARGGGQVGLVEVSSSARR